MLLHGQMRAKEKQAAMAAFAAGEADVLVATTVIEVGVDVPNATVMLVENAERFGISQLHQLRGRVGRGEHASTCLLVGPPGARRLRALAEHGDGFRLAEIDLELRKEGELIGTRQSGLGQFGWHACLRTPACWRQRGERRSGSWRAIRSCARPSTHCWARHWREPSAPRPSSRSPREGHRMRAIGRRGPPLGAGASKATAA